MTIFDFSADKVVKTIEAAHSDSISSMAVTNTGLQLLTGGHDGSLRVWDLRKVGSTLDGDEKAVPLFSLEQAHLKKYDEGVQALRVHPT